MATNITQNPTTTSPPSNFPTEPGPPSNPPRPEGKVARKIEQQTAKVPSDVFLWAALGALGSSLVLRSARKYQASTFLGQWVSPLLLFGVYNKLVKLHGSDRYSRWEDYGR